MSLELLDFPPELVVKIMHMLSLPDLMACKRTNRLLHTLVQETLSLQYLVETHAAGVEQDLELDITLPERLAALKTSNEYWSTFNFKHKKTISTEPFPGLFDLANGIFLHAKLDLLSMCSPEAIRFIFLPSFIQPTKEVQWHAMDVNRKIIGWTSPLQVHDLIAFTTTTLLGDSGTDQRVEIILMHFSTGAYHTAVTQPIIHVAESFHIAEYSKMDICGDTLASLVSQEYTHGSPDWLYLHEWRSGICKGKFNASRSIYGDYQLLSPNIFVVVSKIDWSLNLYSCDDVHDDGNHVQCLVALELPRISADYRDISTTACKSSPNYSSFPFLRAPVSLSTSMPGAPSVHAITPFHSSPENAIIVFIFTFRNTSTTRSFSLVLHRSSLLSYFKTSDHKAPRSISWDDWGPPVCRWFDTTGDMTSALITKGQRFATMNTSWGNGPGHVRIYDFNPLAIRRLWSRNNERDTFVSPDSATSIVTERTLLPMNDFFDGDVASELPYIECTSNEEFGFNSVMIDEERLVGMRINESHTAVSSIDVFY